MAREGRLVGESLLGMTPSTSRPPNTHSVFRYLLVLAIVAIGALYAAPNLWQPDPALQIKGIEEDQGVSAESLESMAEILNAASIRIKSKTLNPDGSALIRLVGGNEDQIRAKDLVEAQLDKAVYTIALNQAPTTPQWLRDLGGKPMSLGLDLSGGVHFLLEVDMEKFIGDRIASNQATLEDAFREAGLRYAPGKRWVQGQQLVIPFGDETTRDQALELATQRMEGFAILAREVDGLPALRLSMEPATVRELEDLAISQNLQSLRNRVNELGVSEPQVQRLGRTRIVLDLPGIQDSARAKEILNKFANLDFRLSAKTSDRASQVETYEYRGGIERVQVANIVTGDQVTNAVQDYDQETQQPQVSISLDNAGGQRMNEVTSKNVGHPMSIIFKELKVLERTVIEDGKEVSKPYTVETKRLISVANINSALGFNFRITGLGLQEARDLALLLRAGALAAPMYIVEERTVGASLGEHNIKAGINSMMFGFALIVLFMLVYYRWFGLAANIALIVNLVLIVAVMSVLGATLTLPGIAGMVLTVGMAVDANVLIFSRIREELLVSKPQQAIMAGFDRAFTTILDANITTFFVAIILFSVGSGPVRGFAVTLAVGIVTSVFTAIVGTRALVNLMYGGRKLESLKI